MRNRLLGGGALAAGLVLVLGLVFVSGQGRIPAAEAQETCADDTNCVIVSKVADDDEAEFSFTTSGGDQTIGGGESFAIEVVAGGSASVTEDETDGWALDGISCDEPDGVGVTVVQEAGSVDVDFSGLDDDEFATVECTFTNEMEEEEATATSTATTEATAEATATATEEAEATTAASTPTTTSSNPSATGTPIIAASTPNPATSPVQSAGVISPPTTGSGGLK